MLRLHTAGPGQAEPEQAATCPHPLPPAMLCDLRSAANGACCDCDGDGNGDCACSTVAALNGLGNQWLQRLQLSPAPSTLSSPFRAATCRLVRPQDVAR